MDDRFLVVDEAGNVISDFDTYEDAYDYLVENRFGLVEPVVMSQEEYARLEGH